MTGLLKQACSSHGPKQLPLHLNIVLAVLPDPVEFASLKARRHLPAAERAGVLDFWKNGRCRIDLLTTEMGHRTLYRSQ